MFSTLNSSQYLNSQINNFMNPQNFTQPLSSSQLNRHNNQEMIQSVTKQNEDEMNIEKLEQNNQSNSDGMVKKDSFACNTTFQTIKQEFNRESPYIKISVYKQHQLANQKIYILQDDKIIGGNQVYNNEIQIIRRKKAQRAGDNNMDFGLSGQESNVEQIPCKILTDKGFRFSSKITPEILVLLSLKYLSQEQNLHSKFTQLPSNVFKLIHQFIKEEPKFYVQDCGTSLKTLIRIPKDKPKNIQINNKYLIGADLYFNVVQLSTNPKQINKQNQETDVDYFFQTLVREHVRDRSRIHGLTKEESVIFQQYLQNYQQLKKKGRKQYTLQNCNRPFLKIQFETPIVKQIAVFIAKEGQQQIFKIGRSQDCDIIVNINTVSRKQTQIKFNRNQWEICDGEGIKQSANGTWQSLQQFENPLNQKSQKSIPLQIEDKMEIKISESVFKFEMVGFGISKRRKLNNSLYKELTNIEQL
ncbi:unnamed protein product [Paramecium pentaurelia]|uniref:FHA domain-containing protein n=1 Tax=Paramecium pentaurelia TaxID=43138 RepID=A0A8S1V3J5_9CILI|nr:unnamed protein product [Paramecium pentaurelia]